MYSAKLVDLPTIIEGQKTLDRKRLFKVADICQVRILTPWLQISYPFRPLLHSILIIPISLDARCGRPDPIGTRPQTLFRRSGRVRLASRSHSSSATRAEKAIPEEGDQACEFWSRNGKLEIQADWRNVLFQIDDPVGTAVDRLLQLDSEALDSTFCKSLSSRPTCDIMLTIRSQPSKWAFHPLTIAAAPPPAVPALTLEKTTMLDPAEEMDLVQPLERLMMVLLRPRRRTMIREAWSGLRWMMEIGRWRIY